VQVGTLVSPIEGLKHGDCSLNGYNHSFVGTLVSPIEGLKPLARGGTPNCCLIVGTLVSPIEGLKHNWSGQTMFAWMVGTLVSPIEGLKHLLLACVNCPPDRSERL